MLAEFFGGPYNGTVIEIQHPHRELRFPVPERTAATMLQEESMPTAAPDYLYYIYELVHIAREVDQDPRMVSMGDLNGR